MKNNQHNIFSIPIWGFIFSEQKYQSRDYIDAILELEKTEPSAKKSNFGGYQTHDNLHKIPVFREFVTLLENIGSSCLEHKVIVSNMWANINYKHCYNGAHIHAGDLSGVFYLKVPPKSGNLFLCNPAVRSDSRTLRIPNLPIVPENLACIMFPSWLEHYVGPNLSDDSRISLAFNFELSK